MPQEPKPRPASVAFTGWLCVILGGVLVLSSGMLALVDFLWRSMEAGGLDPLATLEGTLDPLSRLVLRHLALFSVVQGGLGLVTLVIGVAFLRIRPWSRPALEILAWVTLVASVGSGGWGIVAWMGPGGSPPVRSMQGIFTPVAGMVLTLAQCVACALILRYLRSSEIRSLFRSARMGKGTAGGEG